MKSKLNYTVQIIVALAITCFSIYIAIKESVPGIGIGGTIFSFTSLKYKIFSIYRKNKDIFEIIYNNLSKEDRSNKEINIEIARLKAKISVLEQRLIK